MLGDTHESAGDHGHSRLAWSRALRIFEEIEHPDAELIRAKLNGDRVFAKVC